MKDKITLIAKTHTGENLTFNTIGFVNLSELNLKSLEVLDKVGYLVCNNNGLENLTFHDEIYELSCFGNKLKNLKLNEKLRYLICDPELFNYDECKVKTVTIFYNR
jgi:hypothetical protein